MKKTITWILAAALTLCLAGCGGKTDTAGSAPAQTTAPAKTEAPAQTAEPAKTEAPAQTTEPAKTEAPSQAAESSGGTNEGSHANADGSYRFIYGWENKEVVLYTPEDAVSEGDGIYSPDYVAKDNVFQGMALTFEAKDQSWYCQARDWQSNTANPIEHLAQYYFTGKTEGSDLKNYRQTVTDLGFRWMNSPVLLIVSEYQSASGLDYKQYFVGVEYDNKTAPDGGKGLVGLDFFDGEFTPDQLAAVAGAIFGVDPGAAAIPAAESAGGQEASADASAIIGSWTDPESTWGTCFTFNGDGTGARSATVTGESKPFTYQLSGNKIALKYDDGLEDELTVEPLENALNLTDSYGTVTRYEASEAPAPEANAGLTPADIAGTWLDEDGDGYTFAEDGTGSYKEGDKTWTLTYSILNGDSLSITYSDGDHATFFTEINGDEMQFDRNWVMTRQ